MKISLLWLMLYERPSSVPLSPPPSPPAPEPSSEEPRPARMPHRVHPRVLAGYGTALGALMVAAAWVLGVVFGSQSLAIWFPTRRWWLDVLLGAGIGVAFALSAWFLQQRIPALRRIEQILLASLDMRAMRWHHIVLFSVLAGVPEELLFRGALQPLLGMLGAAIIFGALHAITPSYFLYASTAGLLLGALREWRGGLWASMAAHTAIDALMFALLVRAWRREHQSR